MLHICPQLGVSFLVDSNSLKVIGTSNLRTVRQMLNVLSQLASDHVLAHPSVLFFSCFIRPKFQASNFLFLSEW